MWPLPDSSGQQLLHRLPDQLAIPLYHDALGGDPQHLGNLATLVTVRIVVFLEYPFQLLQLVCRKTTLTAEARHHSRTGEKETPIAGTSICAKARAHL